MIESRCGILCAQCPLRATMGCRGCTNMDKPFWGECCPIKSCCEAKPHDHCGQCSEFPCQQLIEYTNDPEHGDNGLRLEQCRKWREEA